MQISSQMPASHFPLKNHGNSVETHPRNVPTIQNREEPDDVRVRDGMIVNRLVAFACVTAVAGATVWAFWDTPLWFLGLGWYGLAFVTLRRDVKPDA